MLNHKQMHSMLNLIVSVNTKLNGRWLRATSTFLRGAATICAEAIGRDSPKWWRRQTVDALQLRTALVSIAHHLLSEMLMRSSGDIESAATEATVQMEDSVQVIVFDEREYRLAEMDTAARIELLAGLCVARRVSLPLLGALMSDCNMTWCDLYQEHVRKHVFQSFRDDHGFNEGKYMMVWNGQSDHAHLEQLMHTIDPVAPDYCAQVYAGLAARYPAASDRRVA